MPKRENIIGQALKEARLAKDMTQTELAEKLGYSSAMTISHFENGTRPIRTSELIRASQILKCDLESVVYRAPTTTLFRASGSQRGMSTIDRSLREFDKHIQKKYDSSNWTQESH